MSARLLFVSDDLFFWARVDALARAAGREARRVDDEAGMERAFREAGVDRVIADLGARGVDVLAWAPRWKSVDPAPELIAFGSHVDDAALAAARSAGFDRVMPNSRFNREVAELIR